MPERSLKFIKIKFKSEFRRPVIWVLFFSVLFYFFQIKSTSIFGANLVADSEQRWLMLGFSPQQPFRLLMLPWLFSCLIHLDGWHLFQNSLFLLILYFFSHEYFTSAEWWFLFVFFALANNLGLFIGAQFESANASPHIYFGLSALSFSILSFVSIFRVSKLLLLMALAFVVELASQIQGGDARAHLLALFMCATAALVIMSFKNVFLSK